MLVPPNFCKTHTAAGSTVFWCKLGGVEGRFEDDDMVEVSDREPGEAGGVDSTELDDITVIC